MSDPKALLRKASGHVASTGTEPPGGKPCPPTHESQIINRYVGQLAIRLLSCCWLCVVFFESFAPTGIVLALGSLFLLVGRGFAHSTHVPGAPPSALGQLAGDLGANLSSFSIGLGVFWIVVACCVFPFNLFSWVCSGLPVGAAGNDDREYVPVVPVQAIHSRIGGTIQGAPPPADDRSVRPLLSRSR